jgi:3-deoxy-7-phosphoheptulonate synthase
MIIVMKPNTKKEDVDIIINKIEENKLKAVPLYGTERTVIAVIGDSRKYNVGWQAMNGVESVKKILDNYKLASREHHPKGTQIQIGKSKLGNGDFVVIAGPCSIENEKQIMESAKIVKEQGINIMRASAFKPRTSPYSFQGLGLEGLKLLKQVREKTGLLVETEVMDVRDVQIAAQYVDIVRVGARNMQNYDLLKEMGKLKIPVILKRGMSATVNETIMAAEYILSQGNPNVIICERGIRTFEGTAYRNTLDLAAVAVFKKKTHLPVIVDPSHAAGNTELIIPLSKAAIAVGADGLLVETHPNPQIALSDAAQSLNPMQFKQLLDEIKPICHAVGKKLT